MAYLSVSQAAAKLGVTSKTVCGYIKQRRLVAVRLPGGHFRIEERALDDMMTEKREREMERISTGYEGDLVP